MSDREKPDPQSRNDDEASEPTTDDLWRREKPLRDRTVVITRAKARALVRAPDQMSAEAERADHLGRAGEQGDDARGGD